MRKSAALLMWLTVPAIAPRPAAAPAQTADADSSLVPAWVLPRATLRLTLRSADAPQAPPGARRVKGRLLRSTRDSLWVDALGGPGSACGFSEGDLNRIELVAGTHSHGGKGALLGLAGGVTLGLIGTAVIGSAETDNVLPAWGFLVGPFLGAVVGRLIRSDNLVPVWSRTESPESIPNQGADRGSTGAPEEEGRR
jgi:hypothetical protein